MKKKIFLGIAFLGIAAIAAFNVNLNKSSNKLPDVTLANIEAHANWLENWWNSKVYDCQSVQVWKYTCMKYKDIPREAGGWEIGGYFDPEETVCGLFLEWSTDCISGNSVAHCWDC